MGSNKFDDFYSKKSVSVLLEQLRDARITPVMMDKEWYDALITHLNNRGLSMDEKTTLQRILSSDIDSLKSDRGVKQSNPTEQELLNATSTSNDREPNRYTALKTIVGLIAALGYIVIVIGVILLIFLATQKAALLGFVALVVAVVISLPLIAFSNLIYVFIDIEYNTRKTREAIKKD